MHKGLRIIIGVFAVYLCIALSHVWLNIGTNKLLQALHLGGKQTQVTQFRVGFLPVT